MPVWALRLGAILVTGLSMVGSTSYALAHPKNPNAPLRPPVAGRAAMPTDAPEPTPDPTPPVRTIAPTMPPTPTPPSARPSTSAVAARASATRTPTPRPTPTRPTPVPQITLSAGVRVTALPKITYTHSS